MMKILTRNQQLIIIKFINADGGVSSREIQESCNISRKTLTAEVQAINDYLKKHGAHIETLIGKGYILQIDDMQKFSNFRIKFLHDNQRNRYLYIEKNYLAYLILFELFLREEYISIEELCDKFHYSRGTISNSIKIVKVILDKYNATLYSRPNYGLKFAADEWTKRLCLIHFDKIAYRMSTTILGMSNVFSAVLDKEANNIALIENLVGGILRKNHVKIPLYYLTKLNLYIVLTQTRADRYELLVFNQEQLERIKTSRYLRVSEELAWELKEHNIRLREKDIYSLTILLTSYVTRENKDEAEGFLYSICEEDTTDLIRFISIQYKDIEINFDEVFVEEFSCHLVGLKDRILFKIPSDEELGFIAKHEGVFIADLCRDFGKFFMGKYNIKLSESELLNTYYIFSSSLHRNAYKSADCSIGLISRFGINFARDIADRIIQENRNMISEIHNYEFIDADPRELNQYDALFTDIELKKYSHVSIPIIKLDFYREPKDSKVISDYFSWITAKKLKEIIQNQYLVKELKLNNKIQVFRYLAVNYVSEQYREQFVEECVLNDSYTSGERKNRIVFIPAASTYFNKKHIVILFNKVPFIWDNELVQIFILFNRTNKRYIDIKILNNALAQFLHFSANLAQELCKMDAQTIVKSIVEKL